MSLEIGRVDSTGSLAGTNLLTLELLAVRALSLTVLVH
jgi:hypothetical protein